MLQLPSWQAAQAWVWSDSIALRWMVELSHQLIACLVVC